MRNERERIYHSLLMDNKIKHDLRGVSDSEFKKEVKGAIKCMLVMLGFILVAAFILYCKTL